MGCGLTLKYIKVTVTYFNGSVIFPYNIIFKKM